MLALLSLLAVLIVLPLSSGCTAFRTLLPGGPTLDDAHWIGIKGTTTSIASMIDPRLGDLAASLQAANNGDPLGLIMPLTLVGTTADVRQVVCTGVWVDKCNRFPPSSRVDFTGLPIGSSNYWLPTRMVASDFDD